MGVTAEGTVPNDPFGTTRFILSSPRTGEIPLFQIGARPNPTITINAPDRSPRTTGETEPQETTFTVAKSNAQAVFQLYDEVELARGAVAIGYRQDWTLVNPSMSGAEAQVETLHECFIAGCEGDEMDKSADGAGSIAVVRFTIKWKRISYSRA